MIPVAASVSSTLLVSAAGTVFGVVLKTCIDAALRRREQRRTRVARLKELAALLRTSQDVFRNQNFKANELLGMLERNHPGRTAPKRELGYDEIFLRLYDDFTPDERELFDLIRGTTEASMRGVNQRLLEWLGSNTDLTSASDGPDALQELTENLERLEQHLSDWHDKYYATMEDPRHALVYLADEKQQRQHGRGFPRGIERVVERAISQVS